MATITVNSNSISTAAGAAGVTNVTYEYTVTCDRQECENEVTLAMCVSLTGLDKWHNDTLGGSMDLHLFTCEENEDGVCTKTVTRTFPVATHVLNEDWGDDEVQLTLWGNDGVGLPDSGSGEFTGDF